MGRYQTLCLVIAYIMLINNGIAQVYDLTVRQISVAEGLSQSTVTALHIDSRGILWAGTCNGVNFFEGNTIKFLQEKGSESNSLVGQTIRSIDEGSPGVMVFGAEQGSWEHRRVQKTLRKVQHPPLGTNDLMTRIYFAGDYKLVFHRSNMVQVIHRITGKRRIIRSQIAEGKQAVAKAGNKLYWLSEQPAAIDMFDAETGKVKRFRLPAAMAQQQLLFIQASGGGSVVATSSGGFAVFTPSSERIIFHPLSNLGIPGLSGTSRLIFAAISPDSHIWIGIEGLGVFCFDQYLKMKYAYDGIYVTETGRRFNIKRPGSCVFDQAGNIFIGTDGSGIIKINPSIRKFKALNATIIQEINLESTFTKAIYKSDNGTLFFSTLHAGLVVYNPTEGIRLHLRKITNSTTPIPEINFIHPWTNGQLLIGTQRGLFVYNQGKLLAAPFSSIQEHFTHICQSDSATWILGGDKGLYRLQNNIITRLESGTIDQITLLFQIDRNSFLVAEKRDKMYQMILNTGHPTFYPLTIPKDLVLPTVSYNGVARSGTDYYIATNYGLMRFDKHLLYQERFGIDDGIPDPYLYSIVADHHGQLWMGTNKGLTRFSPAERAFRNFTTDDGLLSMEFNTNATCITSQGELFFGGVDGINHFFPEEVTINIHVPVIQLSGIEVFDNRISHDSLLACKKIRFGYDQNTLSFFITATEYTQPERNRVKVWLKGKTPAETYLGPDGVVRYPSLSYGDYTLLTSASNNDGIWSEPMRLLSFTIEPPYYLQGWFIALVSAIGLLLLSVTYYLIYLNNLRRKTRALQHLRAIEKVRINIARDIHDDMGTDLTQIALMAEQLRRNIPEAGIRERERALRLAEKSRQVILSMGEIVWVTNPVNDTLESLLSFIRKILNSIREETQIGIVIRFPEDVPELPVTSGARRKITLLIKEAVNNAMKHSGGDRIEVAFVLRDDHTFELSVSDNGKGMEPGAIHRFGNGMKHLQQYAGELSMELLTKNNPDGGLRIHVTGNLLAPSFSGTEKNSVKEKLK